MTDRNCINERAPASTLGSFLTSRVPRHKKRESCGLERICIMSTPPLGWYLAAGPLLRSVRNQPVTSTFQIHAGLMDLLLLLENLDTTVSYAGCVASYPFYGL